MEVLSLAFAVPDTFMPLYPTRGNRVKAGFSIIAATFALLTGLASLAEATLPTNYLLGSGDVVRIEVFGEDELKKEATVSEIGRVSFPLIGAVEIGGLTVSEVAELIASRLDGRFLVDPKVTVNIVRYRQFFVSGEVVNPGGYLFQPGLTVRSAISFAGGLSERASKKKIYVISESDASRTPRKVDMEDLVGPGDIVLVEESLF